MYAAAVIAAVLVGGVLGLGPMEAGATRPGGDVVDAVTSATLSAHLTHVVTWDLRDAAGLEVSPGEYRVRVEFTERNSNAGDGPGEQLALPFVLGEGPVMVAPPDQGSFADLLLLGP